MSDDVVNLEVDGKPVEARKGQMLIEVTDQVGTYVPRFCYHEKLSIAANCRMCLVEVEKAPKPLPACATPVGEGMKVFTRSPYAIAAQKATMEFLLINHPLDCPICDQGGECELQDLAMGFGRDVSRYVERKRVVKDKDIGPLVSTDMTRCIHCTRCVRFGEEVSGMPELGTTERGEHMQIGTYIEKSIDHELSANIIDLCPVGALNNKPYRYSARSWEMVQRPTIAPHDCVGSNLFAHVLRGTVKRIVPRDNEAINETWISDRDRFSYEGIYSADRLQSPRVKENGEWRDTDWESALEILAEQLKTTSGKSVGMLASPSTTVEEGYLLAGLADHLGTANIDHRLRRQDFSDQENDPVAPLLGLSIADVEASDALLIAGSDVRREAPIIAHRIRKAALSGAKVCFANDHRHEYFFNVEAYLADGGLLHSLAAVAVATAADLPDYVSELCKGIGPDDEHRQVAMALAEGERSTVLLGIDASRHPAGDAIRALAAAIADVTGARFGYISEGANSVGLHLAGVLPHRSAGGEERGSAGLPAVEMTGDNLEVLLLYGVEPGVDMPALAASTHRFIVACTPFRSKALEHCADLLLPTGTFAETSGTFVNCEGRWQSFGGVANPVAQARPGWKVLRVLGNLLDFHGFDYESSEQIRDEAHAKFGDTEAVTAYSGSGAVPQPNGAADAGPSADISMYAVDGLVRRGRALQLTPEAQRVKDRSR
jgi:NADH-quinone oxidoreductase subunit G